MPDRYWHSAGSTSCERWYLFIYCTSIFGEMKHTNTIAASTKREANVVLLLGRRRRRWPNIKTLLAQCLVFAGIGSRQLRPEVTAPTTPLLLFRSQAWLTWCLSVLYGFLHILDPNSVFFSFNEFFSKKM